MGRVAYASTGVELDAWSLRDHFSFVVLNGDRGQPHSFFAPRDTSTTALDAHNDLRFRVLVSYAFVDETSLDTILQRQRPIGVTRGGAVMLNSSHLNVLRLAALADDILLVELATRPTHGTIEFLRSDADDDDNEADDDEVDGGAAAAAASDVLSEKRALTADALHSGRHLAYRHDGGAASVDRFELSIVSLRERGRRTARLCVPLAVRISSTDTSDVLVRRRGGDDGD